MSHLPDDRGDVADGAHAWGSMGPHDKVFTCGRCGLVAMASLDTYGLDYVAWYDNQTGYREWEPVPPQCPVPEHLRPYVANPYFHRRAARARRVAEAEASAELEAHVVPSTPPK